MRHYETLNMMANRGSKDRASKLISSIRDARTMSDVLRLALELGLRRLSEDVRSQQQIGTSRSMNYDDVPF